MLGLQTKVVTLDVDFGPHVCKVNLKDPGRARVDCLGPTFVSLKFPACSPKQLKWHSSHRLF